MVGNHEMSADQDEQIVHQPLTHEHKEKCHRLACALRERGSHGPRSRGRVAPGIKGNAMEKFDYCIGVFRVTQKVQIKSMEFE